MKNEILKAILIFGLAFFYGCDGKEGIFGSWEPKPTVVGIQPFGNIPDREVDSVKAAVERMYEFKVVVLDKVPLPKEAYTEIRYPRYRADTLVKWLSEHVPDSVTMLLGLTNKDISITKYKDANQKVIKEPSWQYRDFGIFGLGRVGGKACVVSSNRLHSGASTELFYKRLTRISCHEVGHVLGLHHCPETECLMNDANETIKTVDKSTGNLCEKCWKKIN